MPHINVDALLDPTNRYEQVDAVTRFELFEEHYLALKNLPDRVEQVAMLMFLRKECSGYRAGVIRAAMRQYRDIGHLNHNEPVYTDEELDL